MKFFVEGRSVFDMETGSEPADCRTISLRCFSNPGQVLHLSLLGKVCALTEEQARQDALNYARELESSFPLDFVLLPLESRDDFLEATGSHFLSDQQAVVSQIWRGKVDLPLEGGVRPLIGFWQTSLRAPEQVWRALACLPDGGILNITLQPTLLGDGDRKFLETIRSKLNSGENKSLHISVLQTHLTWAEAYFKRRLTPFKKFFHLQVSVIVKDQVDNGLARSIGAAFTRDAPDQSLAGYQIVNPESSAQSRVWQEKILHLELIPPPFRLGDLADVEEVYSVFRLPYLHTEKTPLYHLFFNENGEDRMG
ncbi:MAG: hypothetical protein RBS68_12510 [Anaerolineales bacterium]|nr:hypothetical protein [Anaerolineales bacterium]